MKPEKLRDHSRPVDRMSKNSMKRSDPNNIRGAKSQALKWIRAMSKYGQLSPRAEAKLRREINNWKPHRQRET